MARDKKINRVYTLVIPRFEDVFSSFYATELIKGITQASSRLKLDVLIHITEKFAHEDWLASSSLNLQYIDGVIFADINGDKQTLKKFIAKRMPYIVLNNYFEEPINCLAIDNKRAAHDVIKFLFDLGHRKIATITGDLSTQAGKMRLMGFKEAMEECAIPLKEEYIAIGDFLRSSANQAASRLLRFKTRPTAIFAASDVMALEVIEVAKKMGLNVPDDLSVIGFDDNPLNIYSPVALTTVRQPIKEMGALGLEALDKIALKKVSTPFKRLLPAKLIKKDSYKKIS